MTAVHIVVALVYVHALGTMRFLALVAGLTPAVVPAGHVDALRRRIMASMQPRRTLVQILLAGCPDKTHHARAQIGCYALASIQAPVLAHSCKRAIGIR